MTLHLWLSDLTAYSAQIAVVIAIGSALPYLFRLRRPGAMLVYRQALLIACLLLPLLQPWSRPVVESSHGVMILQVAAYNRAPAAPRKLSWEEIVAGTLCAGVLARLCWLGIGLTRLRRRRRGAELLDPLPPMFTDLQLGLDVRPSIGLSTEVSGPVTFGIRNPMILLPAHFLDLPADVQKAIVCHELTHIRRGDWAFTMAEEIVRAVFWFHPCVWWLLGQIQLTREQAVDCEVIAMTAAPEQYINALLAVAGSHLQPDLAPAPLFLRRSHLSQRVSLILKGASMSKQRLLSSLAAICGALLVTARVAVLCFPISAPAQEVVRGEANLLHRTPVEYPADAIAKGIQGTVIVQATLNERGVVTDARVVSGPEPLRKAALKSVLEWHYSGQALSPVEVAIDFKLPSKAPEDPTNRVVNVPGGVASVHVAPNSDPRKVDEMLEEMRAKMEAARRELESGKLAHIDISVASPPLREALPGRIPIREGDEIQPDTLSRVKQAVKDLDEHLDARFTSMQKDGATETTLMIFSTAPMGTVPPGPMPQRIRVGGNVQSSMLVQAPKPAYPPLAKQARIQGVVRLNVVIGKDGKMQDIKAESGHPMLVPAALDAVRQWEYKPTLLNGEPVEVVSVVDVNFTLSEYPAGIE